MSVLRTEQQGASSEKLKHYFLIIDPCVVKWQYCNKILLILLPDQRRWTQNNCNFIKKDIIKMVFWMDRKFLSCIFFFLERSGRNLMSFCRKPMIGSISETKMWMDETFMLSPSGFSTHYRVMELWGMHTLLFQDYVSTYTVDMFAWFKNLTYFFVLLDIMHTVQSHSQSLKCLKQSW
jgi:hypothetical protein